MKFIALFAFCMLIPFSSSATEQDVLVTSDFLLSAGASQIRTFEIRQPKQFDQFVMLGFNPIKAPSISCTLELYNPSNVLLGRYNCAELQVHYFKMPLPAAPGYKVKIEVTNSNFTTAHSAFSVINIFKFISLVP